MAAPSVSYFPIAGRAHVINTLAAYAGADYTWDKVTDWPAGKPETPLGSLPVLKDGDVHIGESMAIYRYLARKWNLQGDTDEDFALSEMLIEYYSGVITDFMKPAFYAKDKAAAWEKYFTEQLPAHLDKLTKFLKGDQFCSKVLAGDIAIFALLDLTLVVEPTALDGHPEIKAFYDRLAEHEGIKKFLPERGAVRFQRIRPPTEKPVVGYWAIRGLGAPLRMMFVFAGKEFDNVMYEVKGKPGAWDTSAWFNEKPALKEKNPLMNLPYVIHGDKVVTQSTACFRYVGQLLKLNAEDEIAEEQCLAQVLDLRNDLTKLSYSNRETFNTTYQNFLTNTFPGHYEKFSLWLEKHGSDYLCGSTPTTADFHLFETMNVIATLATTVKEADPVDKFPALAAYYARLKELPGIQKYLASDFQKLRINNKMASFGQLTEDEDRDDGEDAGEEPQQEAQCEGVWLEKLGNYTGRKPRYFVIEAGQFAYYLRVVDGKPQSNKGAINLSLAKGVKTDGNRILIETAKRTWDLQAKTPEEAAAWATKLKALVPAQ